MTIPNSTGFRITHRYTDTQTDKHELIDERISKPTKNKLKPIKKEYKYNYNMNKYIYIEQKTEEAKQSEKQYNNQIILIKQKAKIKTTVKYSIIKTIKININYK